MILAEREGAVLEATCRICVELQGQLCRKSETGCMYAQECGGMEVWPCYFGFLFPSLYLVSGCSHE